MPPRRTGASAHRCRAVADRASTANIRQLTPQCGVPKVRSLIVCDGHDALPVAARMLVAAHTGRRPSPDPRAGRSGHRRPRRRRRARPGRLRADGRGPALAELMPCSRVTTCAIGPNPALSPTRSRPDPVPAGCCLPLGMSSGISTRSSQSCLLRSSGPARRTCGADLSTNSTPRVAPPTILPP